MGNVHKSRQAWEEWARSKDYRSFKDALYQIYVINGLTLKQTGDRLGVGKDRAAQLLEQCGIPRRSRGGIR